MNKQEVINEIEKIDYQNLKYNSPERMLFEQKQLIIDIIDKLDELQKVKVPKFVGELLDYYRNSTDVDLLALLICFKNWYFRKDKLSENEEAIDWLVRHPEKFMKAWLDGYEVEEEPKWKIINDQKYCLTSIEAGYGNSLHWAFDSTKKKPILFDNEETALYTAYITGGTVEKV